MGIFLPLVFFALELWPQAAALEQGQVGRRAVGGIGPHIAGGVVVIKHRTELAAIMRRRVRSSGAKRGLFTRQDFIYNAEHDHYTCPAGAKLIKIHRRADHTEDFDRYRHLSACHSERPVSASCCR